MKTKCPAGLLIALAAGAVSYSFPERAEAAESDGPQLNPFECLGRYEAATSNRSMSQVRHELDQKLAWVPDPGEPNTVHAIRMCVIGRLKKRLGDNDAYDYLKKAIALDPEEPGLELWAGDYWTGARGSRRPIAERAELHLYRGLDKLEALKKANRYKDYHDVVRDWIHKQLIVLYQQDGQPLLPWKAYPQHGIAGLYAPGVSLQSMFQLSLDTRDFFYNNEMRSFTGEAAWAASDLRARSLTPRQYWDIARAPLRYQWDNRVRLRHNWLGILDFAHSYFKSPNSQITTFYHPTRIEDDPSNPGRKINTEYFNDVTVQQLGASYERVFPLYPLVDLRLAASYRRIRRVGVVEFLEERGVEDFNLYEFKPSVSRFIGPHKLVLEGVYADLRIPSLPGAAPEQSQRQKLIRGILFEFGWYAPLVLPTFESGSLSTYRTPTRGWYWYGGAVQDDEVYGLRTVTARDFFLATRFEGAKKMDVTLQGTYSMSQTSTVRPDDPGPLQIYLDPAQSFSSARAIAVLQYRIINQDAYPAVAHQAVVSDMLNLVIPITYDRKLTGRPDYENVRAGAELWWKFAGNGFGGTTFLVTAGYGAQYFYNIEKIIHTGRLAIRMGWGDL